MSSSDRQRIERVAGSRRARLTPAPGTAGEPAAGELGGEGDGEGEASVRPGEGPNDARMKRDVPPHW